jgi:hypothetical protein
MPRNCIVVLLDSLNRHLVGSYGGREFSTSNLDRFAGITPYNSEVARLPNPDRRAFIDYMPATDCPVIRQPFDSNDRTSMFAAARQNRESLLYDVVNDPDETENHTGERIERQLAEMLRAALIELDAPDDQLARLAF